MNAIVEPTRASNVSTLISKRTKKISSKLESVFSEILDEILRGFIVLKKTCFQTDKCWRVDKCTFLVDKCMCIMYVMVHVVCAGRTDN